MLSDFFKINFPYGLVRNDNGEWTPFNREYMPLGYNSKVHYDSDKEMSDTPIYTKYIGLTERALLQVANSKESVKLDDSGKICKVWLYDDLTNPMNQSIKTNPYWEEYWKKLQILSKLKKK